MENKDGLQEPRRQRLQPSRDTSPPLVDPTNLRTSEVKKPKPSTRGLASCCSKAFPSSVLNRSSVNDVISYFKEFLGLIHLQTPLTHPHVWKAIFRVRSCDNSIWWVNSEIDFKARTHFQHGPGCIFSHFRIINFYFLQNLLSRE